MKQISGKPKSVVSLLHEKAGGSLGSFSASELLCNRRQIYNSKSCKPGGADPIFELLLKFKKDLVPGGRKFVRSVNSETSPCCVLASDSQLEDVHGKILYHSRSLLYVGNRSHI